LLLEALDMLLQAVARRGFATAVPEIRRVGVVGLGLMGHGIVQTSAAAGFKVIAVDSDDKAVGRGKDMIKKSLDSIAARKVKGGAPQEKAQEATDATLANITYSTKRADLADVDLIVEAVPETMEIKTPLYKDLTAIVRKDAIIASNTSGLPIKAMADITGRLETTIGLHYFNPVQIMQLVEVVKLDTTPQSVIDAAIKFVKATGKTPVLCKDTPGFVVNRLLVPYMAQALKLVEDGVASFQDVDVAMKLGAGHPMVRGAAQLCGTAAAGWRLRV
jgi:3-hydroxyacyl-CoA dehydrogenase